MLCETRPKVGSWKIDDVCMILTCHIYDISIYFILSSEKVDLDSGMHHAAPELVDGYGSKSSPLECLCWVAILRYIDSLHM